MRNMMKALQQLVFIFTFLISGQLMASELTSAKNNGLIGEQANGYIGFVQSVSTDVKSMVESVNAKRKHRYQQIARGKKLPLSEVEKIGGQQAIAKTKPGNYIMRAGEGWTRK